jgi:cobalt-precorrin-5B (C1)-methyltransferase
MDMFVIKEGKRMRCGYTTGSCAAAAAKAAALGLVEGAIPEFIEIDTPSGVVLRLKVEKPYMDEGAASCCIVKDAGDDPDVTDGIEIYAKVNKRSDSQVVIDGGEGIGRITRKGFWGEVGEAAINPVPRSMILNEVRKVTDEGIDVLIYSPQGTQIGKKTFNENIGIQGGISIIGTSGIVEPMSDEALKKSIYIEIDAAYEREKDEIILYPGNYAERFLESTGMQGERVKISNYIGDVILYCYNKGFSKVTLVGNIGKLCKLSIGIFNTHSKVCDGRIESFVYYLAITNSPYELIQEVTHSLTAEEALKIILDKDYKHVIEEMKRGCCKKVRDYVKDEDFDIDVVIYSMEYGLL